ncbi:hypothetical protein Tco_0008003 [Tanacetum coccineum]
MSINEYCTEIKSMADRLENLGALVSDKNLVMYAVNGLDLIFATIVEIIRHHETLPTFKTTRNMLLRKELSLNEENSVHASLNDNPSSSLKIHMATTSDKKGTTHDPGNKLNHCYNYVITLTNERASLEIVVSLYMIIETVQD